MAAVVLLAAVEFGQYVSAVKCIPLILIVLIWARLLTWMDKDAEAAHLPRMLLNLVGLSALAVGFVLFLYMPSFFVGLGAFVAILAMHLTVYLVLRQQKVGLADLGTQFNDWLRGMAGGKKGPKAKAGEVILVGANGSPVDPPADDAPERSGYDTLQEIFTDPLRREAERIELVPTEGASAVRYWVDGVSYDSRAVNRNDASAAVVMLKQAIGLDMSDRRKPQVGFMKTILDGKKREIQVMTSGSTAGEMFIAEIEPKKRYEHKLFDMGFTDDQLKVMEDVIADGTGVVILVAPKGQGLTSLLYGVLRRHDAFLSHIQTIERNPPTDLEGITQNELPGNAPPAEEAKLVAWVTSQEPDVILLDRVDDPRSAADLIKYASTGKRAYVGIRAVNALDALEQWRKLVGDDRQALKHLKLVVAGRVMRVLCMACKQEYNPDPDTLRKMNISPDRVGKLFQARGPSNPLRDNRGNVVTCNFCGGLGFKGRTGIYELFSVDDEVRQTVLAGGSTNQLKMLFKKQRRRYLQEVGLLRAVAGDTSLQEVARVMRLTDSPSGSPSGGGGRPSTSSSRRAAPSSGS